MSLDKNLSLDDLSGIVDSCGTQECFRDYWKDFLKVYSGKREFPADGIAFAENSNLEYIYAVRFDILRMRQGELCGAEEVLRALKEHPDKESYVVVLVDDKFTGVHFLSENLEFSRGFMYFRRDNLQPMPPSTPRSKKSPDGDG